DPVEGSGEQAENNGHRTTLSTPPGLAALQGDTPGASLLPGQDGQAWPRCRATRRARPCYRAKTARLGRAAGRHAARDPATGPRRPGLAAQQADTPRATLLPGQDGQAWPRSRATRRARPCYGAKTVRLGRAAGRHAARVPATGPRRSGLATLQGDTPRASLLPGQDGQAWPRCRATRRARPCYGAKTVRLW